MTQYYGNLHLHSTCSDSKLTPQLLVRIGKALGYRALALTDHETDAGVGEFMAECKREGLEALVGAEFYGTVNNAKPHLTALDYDINDPGIREFISRLCRERALATEKSFQLAVRLGYVRDMTWQDVLDLNPDGAWLCIDSVKNAMRLKKVVPEGFDWTAFRLDAFNSPEAKSFRPPKPTAEEVIRTVRKAGGVIALAHPVSLDYLQTLVDYGLNGIEVCHPSITPEMEVLAAQAADTFRLYRCGGTDHTGAMSGNGGKYAIAAYQGVTEEDFFTLKERRLG